ncbi:MAG: hypothetical protein ABR532_09030, partial [Candidatus Dormibacteria bacterium]
MATISTVGTMKTANNNSALCTSIALTPNAIGNLIVLVIEEKYSAASNLKVSSISGGGVTTWSNVLQRFMVDGIHGVDVWMGVVTSTGSLTATVTYASTTGQVAGSINGHELTSTAGTSTIWSIDTTGFLDPNTNATTFNYPTLTSANAHEAYVGYLAIASSASTGSGSGWTYSQDLRGNWDAVNPDVGAAGTNATTSQTSGSSQLWFTVGALIIASAPTTHALAATGLVSTTGSFLLGIPQPLAAAGLVSTSGSFLLGIPRPLAATGLVATTGSFLLGIPQALVAQGLAATTGTFAMALRRALAAAGLISTTGTFGLVVGHIQDPFAAPAFAALPKILECGTWRVFIAVRGGGKLLAELD